MTRRAPKSSACAASTASLSLLLAMRGTVLSHRRATCTGTQPPDNNSRGAARAADAPIMPSVKTMLQEAGVHVQVIPQLRIVRNLPPVDREVDVLDWAELV
eukprot:CAMPEP_0176237710 /NCGR_PEP_ID=MMETSP0121_2-20121125/27989_1 /TAXON_ID=160619 /ORGANISM="Kryptoperidinium foliaceum, Strain CCMP 1326" /LENGTH=100 /DNA_ID=CAMNT_0017577161 /DNA_START=466 /DNA_END=769 /DNA_ORIENTATION=-